MNEIDVENARETAKQAHDMFEKIQGVAMMVPWVVIALIIVCVLFVVFMRLIARFTSSQQTPQVQFHSTEELEKELTDFDYALSPHSATLSPHEVYLLKQAGYEPVQVVFGNVVYSMGITGLLRTVWRAFTRGEMYDFTRLNKDARQLARNRLLEEARMLGATDVFGVVLDTREYADFMEVIATGTAVKKVREGDFSKQIAVGV
jgi:uncharacterized protein YbjQ (UPF0145 family)